jgi:hypothetical protein
MFVLCTAATHSRLSQTRTFGTRLQIKVVGPLSNVPAFFGAEEKQAAEALFRLANYFKSEGYSGLGSHTEPVDRLAARNSMVAAVLAEAMSSGLITRAGNIYSLSPGVIGLDFRSVQLHMLSREGEDFVKAVVRRSNAGAELP